MSWYRAIRIVLLFGVSGKFLFWIRGCLDRGAAVDRPTLIDLVTCVVMLGFLLALEVGEEARKRDEGKTENLTTDGTDRTDAKP
jgi:hypothetical protein